MHGAAGRTGSSPNGYTEARGHAISIVGSVVGVECDNVIGVSHTFAWTPDLLVWQREVGSTATVASTAAVPEPATLLMLISGGLAKYFRRRVALS